MEEESDNTMLYAVIGLVVAGGAGYWYWSKKQKEAEEAAAAEAAAAASTGPSIKISEKQATMMKLVKPAFRPAMKGTAINALAAKMGK